MYGARRMIAYFYHLFYNKILFLVFGVFSSMSSNTEYPSGGHGPDWIPTGSLVGGFLVEATAGGEAPQAGGGADDAGDEFAGLRLTRREFLRQSIDLTASPAVDKRLRLVDNILQVAIAIGGIGTSAVSEEQSLLVRPRRLDFTEDRPGGIGALWLEDGSNPPTHQVRYGTLKEDNNTLDVASLYTFTDAPTHIHVHHESEEGPRLTPAEEVSTVDSLHLLGAIESALGIHDPAFELRQNQVVIASPFGLERWRYQAYEYQYEELAELFFRSGGSPRSGAYHLATPYQSKPVGSASARIGYGRSDDGQVEGVGYHEVNLASKEGRSIMLLNQGDVLRCIRTGAWDLPPDKIDRQREPRRHAEALFQAAHRVIFWSATN